MTAGRLPEKEFSRRAFLRGGGALIVGFGLARAGLARRCLGGGARRPAVAVDQVDSYLTVHADNTVTLYSLDHGAGAGRARRLMIAAEELDIGMGQISRARHFDTPFTGLAGGSQGTAIGGSFVRGAAAARRRRCSASRRRASAFQLRS